MEWIDIDEDAPPCVGAYLVTDGTDIQIMDYHGTRNGEDDWESQICCIMDVTHWMFLPELPDGEDVFA